MKTLSFLVVFTSWLVVTGSSYAAEQPSLDPHLEPLRPMLEKTWKGAFTGSTAEKPVTDVMRWERALNGKAVRVLHSINDGAYGGETIFMWDEKKQEVRYHYFTTAGFMTVGSVTFKGDKWITHEVISGTATSGGVAEVRGESGLRPEGSLHVKTEHLKAGKWEAGHEVTYHEDATAKVVFK